MTETEYSAIPVLNSWEGYLEDLSIHELSINAVGSASYNYNPELIVHHFRIITRTTSNWAGTLWLIVISFSFGKNRFPESRRNANARRRYF